MKYNITYRLDTHPDRNGEVAIMMTLSYCCRRVVLASGIRISPGMWDADAQCPKKGTVNAAGLNVIAITAALSSEATRLEATFLALTKAGEIPSPDRVKAEFRKGEAEAKLAAKRSCGIILEWMPVFVTEMSVVREWTPATKEKFHALAGHIKAVNPDMTFADLDDNGLAKLLEHFRSVLMPDGSIGMKNSTIAKQFGYLGWFLNWATKKGINDNQAFKTFSPALKHTQKKIIYLTDEELDKLRAVDLTSANRRHLERIRDQFMFQCYSGIRYSDMKNLRWTDIRQDSMVITTIKTLDTISVEINQYTREILDKYRPYSLPDNKVFPAQSNQEANRYLKELCRLAGIDEPVNIVYYKGKERIDEVHPKYELITTHAGRRTFVVKALSLGISPYIVMRWTGHSSFDSMKPYMDIVDSAKAEAMQLFNN